MKEDDFCCPICTASIDKEHYMFVVETMMNPEKMRAWISKKWTFEMWKDEKNEQTD